MQGATGVGAAAPLHIRKPTLIRYAVTLPAMFHKCSFLFVLIVASVFVQAQQLTSTPNQPVDSSNKSIPAIAKGTGGDVHITVEYYSPRVRGRMIWGGVVPYNEVWVSGAHRATKITFSNACRLGNQTIAAGSYAFFTIPGTESWTIILNHNFKQHLTDDYDAKEDVLRLTVTPQRKQQHLERLEYFIENNQLIMGWENIRIAVPFEPEK